MACAYLTDLSTTVWQELGAPTDTPVSYIQSKFISQPFIGRFNSLTASCYSIVTGDIVPPLGNEQQGIYGQMFIVDYYTRKANALLNGTDVDYVTIVDGDSRITRATTLDRARLLSAMQKQAETQLGLLIASYRQGLSNARPVDFYNIDSNWAPGQGGYNGPYVAG
jgi:hypothetical protein